VAGHVTTQCLADGEYDWLRKDLLGIMTNSKIEVSAEDIIEQIETEHCKKIHTQAVTLQ